MTRTRSDDNSQDRRTRTYLTGTGSTWRVPSGNSKERQGGYREKSLVLETALNEYRRLRREGQAVDAGDFCGRFPDYRKSLERLIDVEENLGDLGQMEDPFPVPGDEFLGFEILDELGVGAIARVYLATEPELGGRAVVIKVSADGTAEAATLGKLQHPNIVQVYSVKRDEVSGMTAVCMPYQGSATLTDVLDLTFQAGQAPDKAQSILEVANRLADLEALRDDDLATQRPDPVLRKGTFVDGIVHIGIQLADALEYAHSCGVFHRDLKPSNVLLTPHGHPMLLDFNLSFDADRDTMPRGGTLPYMAPEQIRSGLRRGSADASDMTPRCDVFSLGVILYELLTRRLPFGGPPEGLGAEAASLWQLNAYETAPQPINQLNPQVPAPIAAAIERCLAIAPTQRFETLAEVAQSLRIHFTVAQRFKRMVRRHAVLCQVSVAVILLIGVGIGTFLAIRAPLHERQYQEAVAAYQRREYLPAVNFASQAIKGHSTFANAILLRGVAHWQAKQTKEASEDFERSLNVTPSAVAHDYLGCAAYFRGQYQEAVTHFEKATALRPSDARLHYKYAVAAVRIESLKDSANEHLQEAVQLDPNYAEPLLLRARLSRSDIKAATQYLDHAILASRSAIPVYLDVIDQYFYLFQRAPELEDKLRRHMNEAVEAGLSRTLLEETRAYRRFQSQPWCEELAAKALPVTEEAKRPPSLAESMQPSVPLTFEDLR